MPGVGEGGNLQGDWLPTCGPDVQGDIHSDGACDIGLQSCETPVAELTEASKGLNLVTGGCGVVGGITNSASKKVYSGNLPDGGHIPGLDQIQCHIADGNHQPLDSVVGCSNSTSYESNAVGCDKADHDCRGTVFLSVPGPGIDICANSDHHYSESNDMLDLGTLHLTLIVGLVVWIKLNLDKLSVGGDYNNPHGSDCDPCKGCIDIVIPVTEYDPSDVSIAKNISCYGSSTQDHTSIQFDDSKGNANNGSARCWVNICASNIEIIINQIDSPGDAHTVGPKNSPLIGTEPSCEESQKLLHSANIDMMLCIVVVIINRNLGPTGVLSGHNRILSVNLNFNDLRNGVTLCNHVGIDIKVNIHVSHAPDMSEPLDQRSANTGSCHDYPDIQHKIHNGVGVIMVKGDDASEPAIGQPGAAHKFVENGSTHVLHVILVILLGVISGEGTDGNLSGGLIDCSGNPSSSDTELEIINNHEAGIKRDPSDECSLSIVDTPCIEKDNVCAQADIMLHENVGIICA